MKSVLPESIIHSFKKCGVCPFNPSAIAVPQSSKPGNDVFSNLEMATSLSNSFTREQLDLFKRRWEEEYDTFEDSEYIRWLKLNHPESLPSELLNDNRSFKDDLASVNPFPLHDDIAAG